MGPSAAPPPPVIFPLSFWSNRRMIRIMTRERHIAIATGPLGLPHPRAILLLTRL